jgi:putative FmdB family regulatory protein
MPTYDYICTACSNAWELEQRIVEDPIKVCPKCGASTAKRQISSGAGFILKGGGWYADGYGSAKSGASSSSDEASKSAKTDATTPAAEPAKKSESKASTDSPAPTPAPAAKTSAA